jgi:hypothetical protein
MFSNGEEDVRMSTLLLRSQLCGTEHYEPADVPKVIWWSEYSAKASALIQARGMPIDMTLWNIVQENKAAVIAELIRRFDPSHGSPFPIFSDEGEWSYQRFEQWLAYAGISAWLRLEPAHAVQFFDAVRRRRNAAAGHCAACGDCDKQSLTVTLLDLPTGVPVA